MPTNEAPSGTGAVPVPLSGPVMPAEGRPSCSQKTRPRVAVATEVIRVTRGLRHVHTVSTHGESDARESKRSGTGGIVGRDEYRAVRRVIPVGLRLQPVTGKEIMMEQMSPTTAAIGTP